MGDRSWSLPRSVLEAEPPGQVQREPRYHRTLKSHFGILGSLSRPRCGEKEIEPHVYTFNKLTLCSEGEGRVLVKSQKITFAKNAQMFFQRDPEAELF